MQVSQPKKMKGVGMNALTASALSLVILVVVVAVSVQILGDIQETQTTVNQDVYVNETHTVATDDTDTLSNVGVAGSISVSLGSFMVMRDNVTNNMSFTEGIDYNISSTTGVITWYNGTTGINNTPVNFSYTRTITVYELEGNITGSGITAMDDYADWFATIVTIIIAVVIIGLIVGAFTRKQMSGGL